jgi:GntR family transcriptional regulator
MSRMAWDDAELEHGPVPLWFQISERLREAIMKGEFTQGDALPSESVLNRTFGISRTTARSALDQLENDGLVSRRAGRGSIVLPPKVDQPLNLLASFAEDMNARGLVPSYRALSIASSRLPAEVAVLLDVERGTKAIAVERLLLADGQPLASSLAWLSPNIVPVSHLPAAQVLGSKSLYQWIETTVGVRITFGEEYIEAGVAESPLDERLGIRAGSPVLIARRLSRCTQGRPVEHAVMHYRADRYRFRIEVARP